MRLAPHEAVTAHHLRADQRRAETPAQQPKRQVADAGQRRQHGLSRKFNIADAHGLNPCRTQFQIRHGWKVPGRPLPGRQAARARGRDHA
ncbi:hypothetical protein RZS08_28970, partial [Arthrospira platensis SPKY1]|nr:hypothetical protein [Arthrospira platensis SPKY1]